MIDQTIPESIRNRNEMKLDPPMSESDYLTHLKISSLNKVYKTYIRWVQQILPSCGIQEYFRKS